MCVGLLRRFDFDFGLGLGLAMERSGPEGKARLDTDRTFI